MKQLTTACILILSACAPGLPGPGGGSRSVAPTSGQPWAPEHLDREPLPASTPTLPSTDLLARRNALTLTDVVDIALRNSPTTR
ncbi:MAG: hypothetical protein JF590_04030, partial [Gemmatimonadetes bacterium]|nr:hypothetical protein [Gemmatimonadota bacterium]